MNLHTRIDKAEAEARAQRGRALVGLADVLRLWEAESELEAFCASDGGAIGPTLTAAIHRVRESCPQALQIGELVARELEARDYTPAALADLTDSEVLALFVLYFNLADTP